MRAFLEDSSAYGTFLTLQCFPECRRCMELLDDGIATTIFMD